MRIISKKLHIFDTLVHFVPFKSILLTTACFQCRRLRIQVQICYLDSFITFDYYFRELRRVFFRKYVVRFQLILALRLFVYYVNSSGFSQYYCMQYCHGQLLDIIFLNMIFITSVYCEFSRKYLCDQQCLETGSNSKKYEKLCNMFHNYIINKAFELEPNIQYSSINYNCKNLQKLQFQNYYIILYLSFKKIHFNWTPQKDCRILLKTGVLKIAFISQCGWYRTN